MMVAQGRAEFWHLLLQYSIHLNKISVGITNAIAKDPES